MSASSRPRAKASETLETSHSDASPSLVGYPHFLIPLIGDNYIPNGAAVARALRHTIDVHHKRLPNSYRQQLGNLCEVITDYGQPYIPTDPSLPFSGLGDSACIFAAFFRGEQDATDDLTAGLQLWLLWALHRFRKDAPRGATKVIKTLATFIASHKERKDPLLRSLTQELHSNSRISVATAEKLADRIGFHRNPSRIIAIRSITSIPCARSTRSATSNHAKSCKPPATSESKEGDVPSPRPKCVSTETSTHGEKDVGKAPESEVITPDPRLHLDGQLTPDTESSLTSEEARTLFSHLTQLIKKNELSKETFLDLVISLMLLTARDPGTIILALHQMQQSRAPEHTETLNIEINLGWWVSIPHVGIPFAMPESPAALVDNYSSEINLPLPDLINQCLAAAFHSPIDPACITRTELNHRIRDHRSIVPRLTKDRLRRTLPTLMYAVSGHPRGIQLLLATDGFRSEAPLAYYAPMESTISDLYADALLLADIDVVRFTSKNRVGAPRAAFDGDLLRQSMSAAFERLQPPKSTNQKLSTYVRRYNDLVAHTALLFGAVTAHRMTFALAATRRSEILRLGTEGAGIAYIGDKRHTGADRIAAIPACVLDQIDHLVVCVKKLKDALIPLGKNNPAARHASERLTQALEGRGPLFVQVDPETYKIGSVSASKLRESLSFPIDVRMLRHWFSTRAEEIGLAPADIAQQMGHRIDGIHYKSTDPDSPLHFAERVSPLLTNYLEDLEIGLIQKGSYTPTELSLPPFHSLQSDYTPDITSGIKLDQKTPGPENNEDPSISVIQPRHIEAYRIARTLESHLVRLIGDRVNSRAKSIETDPEVDIAARILVILWGVSTDSDIIRSIIENGALYTAPGLPIAACLIQPNAHVVRGVQLVSPQQAAMLSLALKAPPGRVSDENIGAEFLSLIPELKNVFDDTTTIDDICLLASMARRLTAPGHRAAWERGELAASGPRPDRLLALTTQQRVTPADPQLWARSKRSSSTETDKLYDAVRKALYRYQQDPVSSRRRRKALEAASLLCRSTPKESVPYIVAKSVHAELSAKKAKSTIEASTLYGYVTSLSDITIRAMLALDTPSIDPRDTTEALMVDWLAQLIESDRALGPAHWLVRRTSHGDLPPDFYDLIGHGETPVGARPQRAGDPITGTECDWLTEALRPESSLAVPARTVPLDRIHHTAFLFQMTYRLRTRELANPSWSDWIDGYHRPLLFLRPRRNTKVKRPASKRIVAVHPNAEQYAALRHAIKRLHGSSQGLDPKTTNLIAIRNDQSPYEWAKNYQIRVAQAAEVMMENNLRLPFRPHSGRHSYATARCKSITPQCYPHLTLDLPYLCSDLEYLPRWSKRTSLYYISRQLGHGSPLTTLNHYDHSIPLMTYVTQGWGHFPGKTLAPLLGMSYPQFRKAQSRVHSTCNATAKTRSLFADFPCLTDQYCIAPFPSPRDARSDEADKPLDATDHTNQEENRIERLAIIAIATREGYTPEHIGHIIDRSLVDTEREITLLKDAAMTLGTSFLEPVEALRRRSRLDRLLPALRHLHSLPDPKLIILLMGCKNGSLDREQIAKAISSHSGAKPEIPTLGKTGRQLLALVLYTHMNDLHGLLKKETWT